LVGPAPAEGMRRWERKEKEEVGKRGMGKKIYENVGKKERG